MDNRGEELIFKVLNYKRLIRLSKIQLQNIQKITIINEFTDQNRNGTNPQ